MKKFSKLLFTLLVGITVVGCGGGGGSDSVSESGSGDNGNVEAEFPTNIVGNAINFRIQESNGASVEGSSGISLMQVVK